MSDTQPATTEKNSALNLYQKLAAITGEIGVIKKGGTNKEQGYAFIEYAAVAGELRALFAKYGVVIVPRMAQSSKQARSEVTSKYGAKGVYALIDFTFTVINADDPEDKFTVQWTGEAMDYGDKAANKAATGALKYYLMRQFNISEKGDDPDADSPEAQKQASATAPQQKAAASPAQAKVETITKAQLAIMFASLKGKGIEDRDTAKAILHALAGVESLTTLTKVEASELITELKKEGNTKEELMLLIEVGE